MDRLHGSSGGGGGSAFRPKQALGPDYALASDIFDKFCNATTLKTILGYHRQLCDCLSLKPNHFNSFYPKLRQNVNSWRAKALWKKFDVRASHRCYNRSRACPNTRVLVVGAGPCGLRTAIEAQLLGAKVVVIEKRDRISRNNVLHLWPFVIEDLRALGAKKFFGKFCAGAIDHISIRQLQCILFKVALLLGVEIHTEVSFLKLLPPPSKEESQERIGWRGTFSPADHPVSQYEFDVLIGADGRRNTVEGFKRKEFRGRLAIAITANFINKRTEAEARVEEISGVAFIFNQKFFKDLYEATGIDLENIVYYKDDTHYFVMTAKKHSLLDKGVILNDIADTSKLLAPENVDVEALQAYAREAADFSTQYQMPDLEFAVNHYGNPDVNMFDFTSMYAAETASKVIERNGYRLLMILVGDSLLEPFWPTGSGCARGFLSSLDACWAIRGWSSGCMSPLDVLAERESIYRLLGQTTPENLQRDSKAYTLDPSTRYPNLNRSALLPIQVQALYDTDDPVGLHEMISAPPMQSVPMADGHELHKKRRRRDTEVHPETLLQWLKRQVIFYDDISIIDLTSSFKDGLALCAIIHRYRPDLLDFNALKKENVAYNNQLAFDILEKELGVSPVTTGHEMATCDVPDLLNMLSYLTQIYDTFRGEIPHIKHPKLDISEVKKPERSAPIPLRTSISTPNVPTVSTISLRSSRPRRDLNLPLNNVTAERKPRKRRSVDKVGATLEERQRRLEEIVANRNERMSRRKHHRRKQTEQFLKSMQMLQTNAKLDEGVPFEDYSIFLYRQTAPNFEDRVKDLEKKLLHPDRDVKIPGVRGEKDEEFSGRIKDFEEKLRDQAPQEKKPKDLLRAIGKIETTDWNVKEIEKKINENKMGKSVNREREKVPKWNAEQFLARRTKMEKKGVDRQDSEDKKYAAIDKSLKQLDQKLKEGNIRDLKQNKVSTITEHFKKQPESELMMKPLQKSNSKVIVPAPGGSENCHFCSKRVYLMERLSAEGRFFHRGCFRCQYCNTILRLGNYLFDRDGKYGHRFYCSQHFGMSGQLRGSRVIRKNVRSPEKVTPQITSVDLIDRVQTPERVEFSNMSPAGIISDHEESISQMDEDEWTDRNFGASAAELGSSDEDDSSDSESESDDDEAFEEALDEPVTKESTHRLAKEWVKRYSKDRDQEDDDSQSPADYDTGSEFSYENSSDDDESDTATEGEEEIRARELRKQEVRVKQPIVQTDTGSDTEMASDEELSSSDKENSATDIPTDSEFDHDERIIIVLNDENVTKTRGSYYNTTTPKKVQVKSGELQRPANTQKTGNIELKFTPIPVIVTPKPDITNVKPTPLVNPRKGDYLLNRTQSTGGIASKVSLELKKKYLLGNTGLPGTIQKSGSTTVLDSKFKLFHSNISEHQKLLNPAPEISPTMQAFLQGTSKLRTPLSPTFPSLNPLNKSIEEDTTKALKSPEIIDLTLSPNDKFSMQPDLTKDVLPEDRKIEPDVVFSNDTEGRPRSPVHETSIIVPEIPWNKPEKKSESDIDTDSLSSDSEIVENQSIGKVFNDIPRVEVHDTSGELLQQPEEEDIAMDSLIMDTNKSLDQPKSILSEKKTLNQPKVLPALELGTNQPKCHEFVKEPTPDSDSESVCNDATTALTETELSDWARDGAVSDNLEDVEFDLDPEKKLKKRSNARIAVGEDFEDTGHVCGKDKKEAPLADLDSIEYMDTGPELNVDDYLVQTTNNGLLTNKGYAHFINDQENDNDSLNLVVTEQVSNLNSNYNETVEAINKNIICDNEDDLLPETGTTTEENTVSDSTVKNLGIELEEEKEGEELKTPIVEDHNGIEYDEHVKRLQNKYAEFGFVRDSIDIRKSKRKNDSPPLEAEQNVPVLTPGSPATSRKLEEINKERSKQQDLIRDLVLDKVKLQKRNSEKKRRLRDSFSPNPSPIRRNFELAKSATIDITPAIGNDKNVAEIYTPVKSLKDLNPNTPARPLSLHGSFIVSSIPLKPPAEPQTPVTPPRIKYEDVKTSARARARLMSDEELGLSPEDKMNLYRQMAKKNSLDDCIRDSIESLVLNTEKRNTLLQNDTLKKKKQNGSMNKLKPEGVLQNSFSNSDITNKLSLFNDQSTRNRTKSVSELPKTINAAKSLDEDQLNKSISSSVINQKPKQQFCKSEPNLLCETNSGKKEKKGKDRDRRKSIIKSVTEFFQKKKETKDGKTASTSSGSVKDRLSKFRISPKSKEKSKEQNVEPSNRSKSLSDTSIKDSGNISPPPIPPPPLNYSAVTRDESGSDAEYEWKKLNNSSDTLDQSCTAIDGSTNSLGRRKVSRSLRKASKQAQIKRHRLAQEIQRKLEETEVKTRELEQRGVLVEKALRGETADSSERDESDLLREWFDLMRDRTELRRYEKELIVRAEELELEDRHARLQQELRERLATDDTTKTQEDVAAEGAILSEMLEIVTKRDSLIALLEEDRQRYHEEDRDFEAQMLAKGLRLTPIK